MKLTDSVSINGIPGTGKSMATAEIVTKLGLQAVVLDFENKYQKTIDERYSDFRDQFEVHEVIKRATVSKTDPTKKTGKSVIQQDMKITFKNAPDYLASCTSLIQLMDEISDRIDFNVLIMDGATPIIRNHIGLAYWKSLHPDRVPQPVEWGAMNDFEQSFIDAGIGWAETNGCMFIVTGQMKDEYKDNVKIGDVPGISYKCQHSIDVVLEMQKKVYRDHVDYKCLCLDSIKGSFTEQVTEQRGVFEILLDKGLIGYE